jgi:hypothetical protein
MIDQIRELNRARPFVPYSIELEGGRHLNVYDPERVAYTLDGYGLLAVAYGTAFVMVNPAHIVAIGPVKPPRWKTGFGPAPGTEDKKEP